MVSSGNDMRMGGEVNALAGDPRGDGLPWIEPSANGAYEEEPLISRTTLLAGLIGFLVLLAAVIGLVYWFMTRDQSGAATEIANSGGDAELIRAPEAPFKIRPDDQGGVSVPDQDKTSLAEAGGDAPDLSGTVGSTTEDPLPPPLPEPGPEPMTEPPVPVPPAPVAKPPVAAAPKPPVAKPPVVAAATPKPPVATPKPPVVAPPVAKPAAPKPAPAVASGAYVLQLGAFSSRDRAMAGWSDYQSKYSALGGLSADVQSIQSGGKTLFRLRASSLSSESAANAKCAEIKSQGLNCIVAKR
jgi:cell division septation protein DedD